MRAAGSRAAGLRAAVVMAEEYTDEVEERLVNEEYKIWKKNTPFLYGAPSLPPTPSPRQCLLHNQDFEKVAEFLDRTVKIALDIQSKHGKLLKDFEPAMAGNADIAALKEEVTKFARSYPMPGFSVEEMTYKQ